MLELIFVRTTGIAVRIQVTNLTVTKTNGTNSVRVLYFLVSESISMSRFESTAANERTDRPEARRKTSLNPNSVPGLYPNIKG